MQTTSLINFPLLWRWTQETHNVLPKNDLNQIKPLSKEAISEVSEIVNASLNISRLDNDKGEFEIIESIKADNFKVTQEWLNQKIFNEEIIVCWDNDLAVLTNSNVFIKYWDDFCYPSSDEVLILPTNKKWVLRYYHFEEFDFAKRL